MEGASLSHNYSEHHQNYEISQENRLHVFYIRFDLLDIGLGQDKVRFYEEIFNDIPCFAFGPQGLKEEMKKPQNIVPTLREAARKIYSIPAIKEACEYYCGEMEIEDKYFKRGEFGELILYHFLCEYFQAEALISKIYFKDSVGGTAHGFDAVHVDTVNKVLWLGESKLYRSPRNAINALVEDVKSHFTTDFLNSEFQIITNRIYKDQGHNECDEFIRELLSPNTRLLDRLAKIKVALFAGFESAVFETYVEGDESSIFHTNLTEEASILYSSVMDKISKHTWSDNLDIYVFLFPYSDKKELMSSLHNRLRGLQQI